MSGIDINAVIRDTVDLAKRGVRVPLALIKDLPPAQAALAGAVFDQALDALIWALREKHAIVTAPAISLTLRDHDEADDPGAAPPDGTP